MLIAWVMWPMDQWWLVDDGKVGRWMLATSLGGSGRRREEENEGAIGFWRQ